MESPYPSYRGFPTEGAFLFKFHRFSNNTEILLYKQDVVTYHSYALIEIEDQRQWIQTRFFNPRSCCNNYEFNDWWTPLNHAYLHYYGRVSRHILNGHKIIAKKV